MLGGGGAYIMKDIEHLALRESPEKERFWNSSYDSDISFSIRFLITNRKLRTVQSREIL